MEVPLAAILGQDVVDVDLESADQRAWIRRGAHHALVENGGGVDLIPRPGSGLPGPPAAGRARTPHDAIGCGPLAHVDSSVDAGALHSKHRVDSAKPLQRDGVPGVAVDVLVDGEKDRCTMAAPCRGVQLPGGASVGDAAGEPAREVRRCRPARLAVLILLTITSPAAVSDWA
jgi:hypothetical protein